MGRKKGSKNKPKEKVENGKEFFTEPGTQENIKKENDDGTTQENQGE